MGVTSVNSVSNNLDQAILVRGLTALLVGIRQTGPLSATVWERFQGEAYLIWELFLGAFFPSHEEAENKFLLGDSVKLI